MKFSSTPPESTTCHHYSACHDGAPDNPAPSCRSRRQSSIRHNLLPKSDGPSTAFSKPGTPTEGGERFDLSISSTTSLYSHSQDTRYACDLCSLLLLKYERLHYRISVSTSRDISIEYHPSTQDNDISLPIPHDTSSDLRYAHCDDSFPWCNGGNFYRNFSRRNIAWF